MTNNKELSNSFLALVVAEVDEKQLHSDGQGRLNKSNLPIRRVTLPVPNIWTVAVLSWRWDTARPGPSLNILAAVRHARSEGIEYLFIDAITIDQNRKSDDLIQEVFAFPSLYETLPVIAAYDCPREDKLARTLFRKTMLRPWIVYEMRKYRNNPYRVTYIGHQLESGSCDFDLSKNKYAEGSFPAVADFLWSRVNWGCYTHTVLGILTGEISMAVISDFRFILPAYAHIIDVAHETMSRGDYLLTIALLCQTATRPASRTPGAHLEAQGETKRATLGPETFTRYTIIRTKYPTPPSLPYDEFDICLDGQKVARWIVLQRPQMEQDMCALSTEENTEYTILKALGLQPVFEEFVKNEASRKACMSLCSFEASDKPVSLSMGYVDLGDVDNQTAGSESDTFKHRILY